MTAEQERELLAPFLERASTGGILVAFAARQHPLGIILCATLIGGIEASGSLLQRRLDLPDATTLILEGLLFTNLLAWEALNGRITRGRIALAAQGAAQKGEPRHG